MLSRLGIETHLQLAITVCVVCLIVVTTLGGSGGAPWVYLTYRTMLVAIAILGAIGARSAPFRTSWIFRICTVLLLALMLISVLRIQGSHFEGFYLWFKYAFFAAAFLNLANYARYQSARWRGFLIATMIAVCLAHLIPDLVRYKVVVAGFSKNNPNYFATFLLIGLAASIAAATFGIVLKWRVAAAISGALLLFGIVRTSSRGATLAAAALVVVAAFRARGRIPRQVWLVVGLAGLLATLLTSPFLISKFADRGQIDPYNYARTEIWKTALNVIAQNPILGTGFGQFYHVSKRFTLPMNGVVARYLKRAQMAHNEYLQHIAELGIPAAFLLFGLLGYLICLVWKRANSAWPEFRWFNEAALLTAVGVGIHALVDNCWTIPVTASGLVVLALADPLPLKKRDMPYRWGKPQLAIIGASIAAMYVLSTAIPGTALYYNDEGHKAYDRDNFTKAEQYHLAALAIVPNHPLFLDNLGMVYLQQFTETGDKKLLEFANQYFRKAIEANPRSLDPHIHLETVLLRSLSGDPSRDGEIWREVVRADTELLEVDPFIPFPRKNLASAYYNIGQTDRALIELQKALSCEPNYVPGYLQMAMWYEEQGDQISSRQNIAMAVGVANKYRDFKPTEIYEALLLGRPPESWVALTEPKP